MCGRLGQRIVASLSLGFGDKEAAGRPREAENLLNEIASINAPDQVEAAITACDELIARFHSDSEWPIGNIVAAAMLHKAALLCRGGKSEEALGVYEEIAARFSGAQEPALRERAHDALERKRSLLRMIPNGGARLIAAHDELLKYYAETPEQGLEAKIAIVLLDKAVLLRVNRRSEPAIGLCNEIEARFSTSDRTEVREQVAKALFQKSAFLAQIGRVGEANKVFEELVERFSGAPEQSIRDWLGPLMASKAEAQKKHERAAHLDELIGRFVETGDPSLRVQVAEAFNEKAFAIDLGPRIKILDELLRYFSEASEAPIRLQVAVALSCKAGTLSRMFRIEEQKVVFAEFLRRFAEAPEAEIRARVAGALLWRARDPLVKARSEQVVAELDELLRRFSQEREPEIEVVVADAMFDRVTALAKMGRQDEQIAACNEIISRFANHQELRVRRVVAKSFLEKGRLLGSLRKTEDEVEVYHEFLKGFSGDSEEVIQEFISDALLGMGHAFAALEKPVEAIAALDELIQVQSKLRWGMQPRRLAELLLCKAKMLEHEGRMDEAGAAYQELLTMGSTVTGSILWLVPFSREARKGISRLGYVATTLP